MSDRSTARPGDLAEVASRIQRAGVPLAIQNLAELVDEAVERRAGAERIRALLTDASEPGGLFHADRRAEDHR